MKCFIFVTVFFLISFATFGISEGNNKEHTDNGIINLQLGKITMDQAIERALNVIPGKVVETEREHGVYEIKIRSIHGWEAEVYVDPFNGTILKIKGAHDHRTVPRLKELTLNDARKLVEKRIRKKTNLKIGKIVSIQGHFEVEILSKDNSLHDALVVHKDTGAICSAHLHDKGDIGCQ